jgi:hypothetical protein
MTPASTAKAGHLDPVTVVDQLLPLHLAVGVALARRRQRVRHRRVRRPRCHLKRRRRDLALLGHCEIDVPGREPARARSSGKD